MLSVLRKFGPHSLPKRLFHRGSFFASFFNFQNIPFFLTSSARCLRLPLRPHSPSVFPSVDCFIRHFLRNTWCCYKINGFMLVHSLFKKLQNRNFVTLDVLPSSIPTPLHASLPLLGAMLQFVH